MHEKINVVREDIKKLTKECEPIWTPYLELDIAMNHCKRLTMVKDLGPAGPNRAESRALFCLRVGACKLKISQRRLSGEVVVAV